MASFYDNPLETAESGELARIRENKMKQLMHEGIEYAHADRIWAEIDIEQFRRLTIQGCPGTLAARIAL